MELKFQLFSLVQLGAVDVSFCKILMHVYEELTKAFRIFCKRQRKRIENSSADEDEFFLLFAIRSWHC